MFIIFEGMDNVGKTTQIFKLESWFARQGKIVHKLRYNNVEVTGKEHQEYAFRQYRDILELTKNSDSVFIADRFHLGEAVYGNLYRNYDTDITAVEQGFEDKLILIYLWAPIEELLQREDGQSFAISKEKKELESRLFIMAFRDSTIRHKVEFETIRTIADVQESIRSYIQMVMSWNR